MGAYLRPLVSCRLYMAIIRRLSYKDGMKPVVPVSIYAIKYV